MIHDFTHKAPLCKNGVADVWRDVIKGMVNYQSQATSAPNTAAQHAAAVALTMPQDLSLIHI